MVKHRNLLITFSKEDYTERYIPTKYDIDRWYRTINKYVFDGKLPKLPSPSIKVVIKKLKQYDGWFVPGIRKHSIILASSFESKHMFVRTLAHEMIHFYDFLYCKGDLTHGIEYKYWKKQCKLFGINT
jgi:hypothetical protein